MPFKVELPVCVGSLAPPRSPASAASTALDLRQHRRGWRPRWTCRICSPGDEDVERESLGSNGCRRWAPHAGRLTLCRVPLFRRIVQGAHGCLVPVELSTLATPPAVTVTQHSAVSAPCAFHHAHGACLAPLKNCSPHQRVSERAPVTSGLPARVRAQAQARCRPQTVR